MKNLDEAGYNERLFSGGLRTRLHTARFAWLRKELKKLNCKYESVLELGCFDGKLIDFLPKKPERYKGFDANWENGLDLAREKWKSYPNYTFSKACSANEMSLDKGECFDIAVVMETFEHVPPYLVSGYLEKIARHLDGYLFITVPNEKGIFFLSKLITKRVLSKDGEKYSLPEVINATLGRTHLVERDQHKGFDYDLLAQEVEGYLEVVSISGHPLSILPTSLNFGVGIVAKSKRV
jgi:2-polyprenyl-3-methyl-5-hydroxy-6-metoxy-1,4-benzoquinol methylase